MAIAGFIIAAGIFFCAGVLTQIHAVLCEISIAEVKIHNQLELQNLHLQHRNELLAITAKPTNS